MMPVVLAAELSTWVIIMNVALGLFLLTGVIAVVAVVLIQREIKRWDAEGLSYRKGPATANYRGHASVKVPVKGTGVLALTDDALRFARALPRTEFIVPLDRITRVEYRKTWKSSYRPGNPVLVVHYRDDQGEDALGVTVKDLAAWGMEIAAAANVAPPVDAG